MSTRSRKRKYLTDNCCIDDCQRKREYGRKYCVMHRGRVLKHGHPGPVHSLKGQGTIKDGYRILTKTGNPTASKDGRIPEHRLIMSEHLKRPLLTTEYVHHKNGNKLDNSVENLELWIRMQPPGQRIDDMVKYAEQILKQYAPHKLKEE